MAKLKALLAPHGLVLDYDRDRAAIDTGLHLFLEGNGARQASQVRVWFQAKGKMAGTLPLEDYRATQTVAVKVKVDHLRFWVAAPEPVYLVVYVESGDEFIAEDVRDIVRAAVAARRLLLRGTRQPRRGHAQRRHHREA